MRRPRYEISNVDRNWIEQIGWRSVDDVLARSASTDDVAAVSHTSDVVKVAVDPANGGPTIVFVKCYRYDRFVQRIKQAFRGTLFGKSRARREFEFLTEMRRRQIPTVRPIAWGDNYGRAFLRASFLVTEGAEGFQSLDLFGLNALRRNSLNRSQRRALTKGLATTIRRMHDAGIRHGGLYWRNILVGVAPGGGYDFLLIDPDRQGRLNASRVSESDVVGDLSEFVASGMAIGQRAGLLALMKAYLEVSHLTAEQRNLTSQIIERARALAPPERRRMAVAETMEWLRQRTAGVRRRDPGARAFGSLDDFFDRVSSIAAASTPASGPGKVIRFSFFDTNGSNGALDRTVIVDAERVTVSSARPARQDLIIRTDPETWLAVVSGRPDAYARLRAGRLRVDGDTTALPALMEHLDRAESTRLSIESETKTNAESRCEPCRPPAVTATSPKPSRRSFGRKYKSDDYARYYTEKHHAGLGRRISNCFERKMIRRSLLRIRRHRPFESVLDCPSGTGRFLPTLASLNVSVIAMDTSYAMLREGRKQHALFKEPPVELVGSAFDIALPDNAVDVVLCCRLLHHIADREQRLIILREFARVARLGVVVSFFDARSLRAWKRERKTRRTGPRGGRHAMPRAACVEEAVCAGLKPIGMNALFRFHTEVTAAAFLC